MLAAIYPASRYGTLAAVENSPCSRASSMASWVANWGSFPRRCMTNAFSLSASSSSPDLCEDPTSPPPKRSVDNKQATKSADGHWHGLYMQHQPRRMNSARVGGTHFRVLLYAETTVVVALRGVGAAHQWV